MISDSNTAISSRKLLELFYHFRRRSFLFVEPGGNCGDYLIYKGAQKLAGIAGLSYETVSHDQFMVGKHSPADVIYIHGSGGFVPWWSGNPILEFKKALETHTGSVIVGPSTFALDESFFVENIVKPLSEMKSTQVHIFCRELTSYYFVKSLLPSFVSLEIDHDTATNLEKNDLHVGETVNRYTGFFIREDKENCLEENNLKTFFLDPGNHTHDFDEWLKIHCDAKKIITNRLHSSILGTILGKEVVLLPNSFHKNRSVWEFSLKEKSVTWKEGIYLNKTIKFLLNNSLSDRFFSSYKVNKIVKKNMYGI